MNRAAPAILIVDDDKAIRETLSAILQSKGYRTTSAATANEAIGKTRAQYFDLILLDIKLPDMEGTQLLSVFQKTIPGALKIVITGYPSVENVAEALDLGANSYLTKPINPNLLLNAIEKKLQEREHKERVTAKRLEEWIKIRLRKTQSSEFEEFLERNAATLACFALNKTQAKIYIGLNALGVASASEIASVSKVRREEVYRAMPELEKRGIITRKLGTPRRFTTTEPEIALKILTKTRINAMKEETRNLEKKTDELISQLRKASYGIEEENSIEELSQQDNVLIRLTRMTKKARQQILTASSFEQLETVFLKNMKKTIGTKPNQISVHAIVGGSEPNEQAQEFDDVHTFRLLQMTQARNSKIELRRVEMLPFNLLMVDGKEAMWGEFEHEDSSRTTLWTNDSTQIGILKMAFENLWRESQRVDSELDLI